MPSKKDIDRRIKSVKNTKKITYAMKLVSAAKLKRAQDSVLNSRVYTDSLKQTLSLLQASTSEGKLSDPLMEVRAVKNITIIVAGGSRGLAGGYNSNLNKKVEAMIAQLNNENNGIQINFVIVGKKPAEYFRRTSRSYDSSYEELPEEVLKWPIIDVCKEIEKNFTDKKIDEVYVLYTKFKSAMSLVPTFERILPLSPDIASNDKSSTGGGKVKFEPSADEVLAKVIPLIFRSLIQQACLDAKASELASRMTAMDAATKNAGELIEKLTLMSNKLRQGKITSELLDIIGGAEAIK